MTLLEARAAAAAMLRQIPAETHDALEHVEVQVIERPPEGVRSDAVAYFEGTQQWLEDDADPDDPLPEEVHRATGQIVLIAGNLENEEHAQRALCHEIHHALGATEWDNVELGL